MTSAGRMQCHPLLISTLIQHAARFHTDQTIVDYNDDGSTREISWSNLQSRAKRTANALRRLGVNRSGVVATLSGNNINHLELYYAVPGMGAILCTVNPRLHNEQIKYVINHSEAEYVFVDEHLWGSVVCVADQLTAVKAFVQMPGHAKRFNQLAARPVLDYDELVGAESDDYEWPVFDERHGATLSYTSGTTGPPKGVLYEHRSTVLHAMSLCNPDHYCLGANSRFLLVVPMFHANAWGVPYAAAIAGSRLVLPSQNLTGENMLRCVLDEQITHTGAVPTVVQELLDAAKKAKTEPAQLRLERIISGGSAVPDGMYDAVEAVLGGRLQQGWGMTELNPTGLHNPRTSRAEVKDKNRLQRLRSMVGKPAYGVEVKIVDEAGEALPWDGKSAGTLKARGHWTIARYQGSDVLVTDQDGFFDTGDIAVIDPDGTVKLIDRAKDVIKSGGEWISSIDLENAALRHEAIAEAAVVAIPHAKWQERPLMLCVAKGKVDKDVLLERLRTYVAKWWLPDDIIFVSELPRNANGKLDKKAIREKFRPSMQADDKS